jgi:hypothetical protein
MKHGTQLFEALLIALQFPQLQQQHMRWLAEVLQEQSNLTVDRDNSDSAQHCLHAVHTTGDAPT